MATIKVVKSKVVAKEFIQAFPHRFVCKSCGVEYENAETNNPDCPACKQSNCANRIG